jgi:hypothetical protein
VGTKWLVRTAQILALGNLIFLNDLFLKIVVKCTQQTIYHCNHFKVQLMGRRCIPSVVQPAPPFHLVKRKHRVH